MNNFNGSKLRELMDRDTYSANALARHLGNEGIDTSVQSIYAWENGVSPRAKTVFALSKIFNCEVKYFFE